MKKLSICALLLLACLGCQNKEVSMVRMDVNTVDASMFDDTGFYMINSSKEQMIVLNHMHVDPKSVKAEQNGNTITIHFQKQASVQEDVLIFSLDTSTLEDPTIRIMDEKGREYAFETVFVGM
ncbi:hypothetical protein [Faecalicoccus pleomorphus]|uniref:hypothetical protein n=1 Tax=Faecalicoccus pleomorphus TaxID=1323 RepID=UPI0039F4E216